MKQPILDKIDLRIIQVLAKDCRVSYRNIASVVGLSTKSVRARIIKMVSGGVIEKVLCVHKSCSPRLWDRMYLEDETQRASRECY